MRNSEFFTSCTLTKVDFNLYVPNIKFRHYGIVHLIHPFGEHIERYDHFARFLCDKGYIVLVAEYLGHNEALIQDEKGYFGKEYGWDNLIKDLHRIRGIIHSRYEDLPYFMVSVGSGNVLLQSYLTQYGDYIQGAIMVGMFNRHRNLLIKSLLCSLDIFIFGEKHHSMLLDRIVFGHVRQARNLDVSKFDWMSSDEKEIKEYLLDSNLGFIFTSRALKDIITGMNSFKSNYQKSNLYDDFPIFLLGGAKDKIGGTDSYTRYLAKLYQKAGLKDVQYYTYPNAKHFLLHDNCKYSVYDDIISWLTDHVYR